MEVLVMNLHAREFFPHLPTLLMYHVSYYREEGAAAVAAEGVDADEAAAVVVVVDTMEEAGTEGVAEAGTVEEGEGTVVDTVGVVGTMEEAGTTAGAGTVEVMVTTVEAAATEGVGEAGGTEVVTTMAVAGVEVE